MKKLDKLSTAQLEQLEGGDSVHFDPPPYTPTPPIHFTPPGTYTYKYTF